MKIFASGRYNVWYSTITEENMRTKLTDDFRAEMLGNVEDFLYYVPSVRMSDFPNIEYIGNFYCDRDEGASASVKDVYDVTNRNLERIDQCDHLIVNLHKEHAMASVVELMYAASKQKPTTIFYNPDIAGYQLTDEYWFAMITAQNMNPNVKVIGDCSMDALNRELSLLNDSVN